jgi:Rrf2 family protein
VLALTRKADYALVALAVLSKASAPQSARTLADQTNLPHPVLRNILKQLTRGGLLHSTQGASGGYTLARPATQISLAEVVHQIDGPVRFARCCPSEAGHEQKCRLEDSCMIKGSVQQLHETVMRVLAGVNIEQIANGTVPRDPLSTSAAAEYEPITQIRPRPRTALNESA